MPHFQDVIAGHYVSKAELEADQAETNELGTAWTATGMERLIDQELVNWYRRLSTAAQRTKDATLEQPDFIGWSAL